MTGRHRAWLAVRIAFRAGRRALATGHPIVAFRALVLLFRLDIGESCQRCGRSYPLVWHAPSPIFEEVAASHGYHLLCPRCFNRLYNKARPHDFLVWVPRPHAEVVDWMSYDFGWATDKWRRERSA